MQGLGRVKAPPLESRRSLLNWTRNILRSLHLRPRKRLGQHFVVEPRIVRDALKILREYTVESLLEIGPGLGTLTYYLSITTPKVLAVELDARLAGVSRALLPPNAQVVVGDGLVFAEKSCIDGIASNTPYEISSALVAATARNNCVTIALYVVQRELAFRMTAKPGTADYGRLTLLVNRYFETKIINVYPPTAFYPEPDVSSAMVLLKRIKPWGLGDETFEKLTACLFTGRNRKASKMAKICARRLGIGANGDFQWLEGKRVKDLLVEDIDSILGIIEKSG